MVVLGYTLSPSVSLFIMMDTTMSKTDAGDHQICSYACQTPPASKYFRAGVWGGDCEACISVILALHCSCLPPHDSCQGVVQYQCRAGPTSEYVRVLHVSCVFAKPYSTKGCRRSRISLLLVSPKVSCFVMSRLPGDCLAQAARCKHISLCSFTSDLAAPAVTATNQQPLSR